MSWMSKMLRTLGLGTELHPLVRDLENLSHNAFHDRRARLVAADVATLRGVVPSLVVFTQEYGPGRYRAVDLLRYICGRADVVDAEVLRAVVKVGEGTDTELDVPIVGAVERYAAENNVQDLRAPILAYRDQLRQSGMKAALPLAARLEKVLGVAPTIFLADGPLGMRLQHTEDSLDPSDWAPIEALLLHAGQCKNKPSKRWLKQAKPLVDEVPFVELVHEWLDGLDLRQSRRDSGWYDRAGFAIENEPVAKGLVAMCELSDDPRIPALLGRLAEACYRKVPNIGPPSKAVGNQCIRTLGAMVTPEALGQLTRLSSAIKYNQAKQLVDRTLTSAGEARGMSKAELEERGVPRFGLGDDGWKALPVGDGTAELGLDGMTATLVFVNAAGRRLKSVPKAVRDDHPDVLKQLRAEKKDLQKVLDGQVARIERFWLLGRAIGADVLREHYLEHPVVAPIARRLLWSVDGRTAFWRDGALRELDGTVVSEGQVQLWHPLTADPDEQLVWRDMLASLGIQQPFPQLWRGVYRTVERDRFEGRILFQMAVMDHCRRAGWQYQLQGYWDSYNTPEWTLPERQARIQLELQPLEHREDDFKMQFVRVGVFGLTVGDRPVDPGSDPVLASELVRQIDLLVTRCTVKAAPAGGFRDGVDWTAALYGPLTAEAEARAEVLEAVLPRLPLASRCRVEAPFLVVESAEGPVELHLGTLAARKDGVPRAVEVAKKAKTLATKVLLPNENDPALVQLLGMAFQLTG